MLEMLNELCSSNPMKFRNPLECVPHENPLLAPLPNGQYISCNKWFSLDKWFH